MAVMKPEIYLFIIPLAGLQILATVKNNLYEKSFNKHIVSGLNLLTIAAIVFIDINIF